MSRSGDNSESNCEFPAVSEKKASKRKRIIKEEIPPLAMSQELTMAEKQVVEEARQLETQLQKEEAEQDEISKQENPLAGHRQRVKEQFRVSGLRGMSEHRTLEFILFYAIPQKDVADIARDLIRKFGGFNKVLQADEDELLSVKGVGQNTALLLKLLPAVLAYYHEKEAEVITVVDNLEKAYRIFLPLFLAQKNEMIYLLCLNGENEFLGLRKVTEGDVLSAGVHYRRIVTEALNLGAVKVYLAHNHVTGTLDPSEADWNATRKILEILNPLDIYVLDHLIIGKNQKISMRQVSKQKHIPMSWPMG